MSITDPEMRLFSYKMTTDSGFAPNPFGRSLTLATCKPQIRRSKKVGDWIVGFTSGDPIGSERLIYLMRVGQKLHMRDYYYDPRFQDKIPDMSAGGAVATVGDNIYRPLRPDADIWSDFEQLGDIHHFIEADHRKDVSGGYVLIADEFYYFGSGAILLPPDVRPNVPRGQHPQGHRTRPERARRLIEFIRSKYRPGRHGDPHEWSASNAGRGRCG